jgi:ribulose-phosphate 3-epimerase
MIAEGGHKTLIQIDGGVTQENISGLIRAGVDVFVVGNTIFSDENPSGVIHHLKNVKI